MHDSITWYRPRYHATAIQPDMLSEGVTYDTTVIGPDRLLPTWLVGRTLYWIEVQGVNNALQGISTASQVLWVEFGYRRVGSKRTRV